MAALAVLFATPALHAEDRIVLAVMTLEDGTDERLPARLIDNLTDYLRTQIATRGKFVVIDKSRQAAALRKMVGDARKESYKACYDSQCQIPLGKALSADTVLRVKLTRIGSTYQLSAEMVDLASESVDPGAAASVEITALPKQGREDRLLQGVRVIARQIAGDLPGGAGETINIGSSADYGIISTGGATGAGDGIVMFESTPPGASVEVAGRLLPRATPVEEFLKLGKQKVKVFGIEGYETFNQKVELKAGQTIRVTLKPITSTVVIRPRDEEGNLLTDVSVILDGEEIARAPVRIEGVLTGKRRFRFTAKGMRPLDKVVQVRASKRFDLDIHMVARSGTLRMNNLVIKRGRRALKGLSGQVEIAGESRGNTPLELKLEPGSYQVEVKHSMGRPRTYDVDVADDETVTLNPELAAADSPEWRKFVARKKAEQRTGGFYWMSFVSSGLGRYHSFDGEASLASLPADGSVPQLDERLVMSRLLQGITYGISLERDKVAFRVLDSLIDLALFKLPGEPDWVFGASIFTNPTVQVVLRPFSALPFRLDAMAEYYFAWAPEDSDNKFTYMSATGAAHLSFEMWQDYVMGQPLLELSGGARYFYAWGNIDPEGSVPQVDFSSRDLMLGGKAQFIIPTGETNGIFVGGGYYFGSETGAHCILWTVDWRNSIRSKKSR